MTDYETMILALMILGCIGVYLDVCVHDPAVDHDE